MTGIHRKPGEPAPLTSSEFRLLADRMGEANLTRRILREEKLLQIKRRFAARNHALLRLLNKDVLTEFFLRSIGLWHRGRRGFFSIQLVENEVCLPGLRAQWEGFRLLQLSDLHVDIDPEILRPLCGILEGLKFDAALITGDFQDLLIRPHDEVLRCMSQLLPLLGPAPLAVPGNHDLASLIVKLEPLGLRFLLNEHILLERNGSSLAICGVDDPHRFWGDDLRRALQGVPPTATRILLAHSPGFFEQAADASVDFMLCGHTHGGQLCLPGGIPVVRNANVPRELFAGPWRWKNLTGYTSRGTGACGVPVRFFCPPEVTLHTLHCG